MVTLLVVTVNVALREPAATVTLEGTVAAPVSLLRNATAAPPDGAFADNVAVPCTLVPPVTLVDDSDSEDSVIAVDVVPSTRSNGRAGHGCRTQPTIRPPAWPGPSIRRAASLT